MYPGRGFLERRHVSLSTAARVDDPESTAGLNCPAHLACAWAGGAKVHVECVLFTGHLWVCNDRRRLCTGGRGDGAATEEGAERRAGFGIGGESERVPTRVSEMRPTLCVHKHICLNPTPQGAPQPVIAPSDNQPWSPQQGRETQRAGSDGGRRAQNSVSGA